MVVATDVVSGPEAPMFERESSVKRRRGRNYKQSGDGAPMLATSLRARERLSGSRDHEDPKPSARKSSKQGADDGESTSRKPSKHSVAVQKAKKLELAACVIQRLWKFKNKHVTGGAGVDNSRDVAIIRMIYAEARRRHQMRESYQQRQKARAAALAAKKPHSGSQQQGKPAKATVWQLMQCKTILLEALEDIVSATKVCRDVAFGVRFFHQIADSRAGSKEAPSRSDDDDEELLEPDSPSRMYARLSKEIDDKLDREEREARAHALALKAAQALGIVVDLGDDELQDGTRSAVSASGGA